MPPRGIDADKRAGEFIRAIKKSKGGRVSYGDVLIKRRRAAALATL